jgi:hypothetical protein
LVDQRPAQDGLAEAKVAGHQQIALTPAQPESERFNRAAVGAAFEEIPGVWRQAERSLDEAEKGLVAGGHHAHYRPVLRERIANLRRTRARR